MGRSGSFEDGSAEGTLRDLGYSDEEIGKTAGSLPSQMADEDRLRLSLRALSSHNTEEVQRKAAARTGVSGNPDLFEKQERPSKDPDVEYERGRRDERFLKKNDPNYVKPQRARTQRTPSARQQRAALMGTAKTLSALARAAKGKKR